MDQRCQMYISVKIIENNFANIRGRAHNDLWPVCDSNKSPTNALPIPLLILKHQMDTCKMGHINLSATNNHRKLNISNGF